jgi:hypothetical protein
MTGPVLSTCDIGASAEVAVHLARDWLAIADASAYVVGTVAPLDRVVSELLGPIRAGRPYGPRGEGAAWLVLERQSDALERGARVLALITETLQAPLAQLCGSRAIAPPRSIEDAVVVMGVEQEDPTAVLESLGWGLVPRRSVLSATGWHEGLGGFALATAAALVARGDTQQALACAVVSGQCFLTLVESPS